MRLEKLKGTLIDFNALEHVLDDCPWVRTWQLELRKRNDDPLQVDELILHVAKEKGVAEETAGRDLDALFPPARRSIPTESSSIPKRKCGNSREWVPSLKKCG
jgi:hypothetical protein